MRHIIEIAALALLPLVPGDYAPAAENEGKVITLRHMVPTNHRTGSHCKRAAWS